MTKDRQKSWRLKGHSVEYLLLKRKMRCMKERVIRMDKSLVMVIHIQCRYGYALVSCFNIIIRNSYLSCVRQQFTVSNWFMSVCSANFFLTEN